MNRLKSLFLDFAKRLQQASPAQQRAAALAACTFAISRSGVAHAIVDQAIKTIELGCILAPDEKERIDALVVQLDTKYLELQEQAEDGDASIDDYLRVFSQARAVAAVSFAGTDGSTDSLADAIYEAAGTTDTPNTLLGELESFLAPN